jgi:hypothetical protein
MGWFLMVYVQWTGHFLSNNGCDLSPKTKDATFINNGCGLYPLAMDVAFPHINGRSLSPITNGCGLYPIMDVAFH